MMKHAVKAFIVVYYHYGLAPCDTTFTLLSQLSCISQLHHCIKPLGTWWYVLVQSKDSFSQYHCPVEPYPWAFIREPYLSAHLQSSGSVWYHSLSFSSLDWLLRTDGGVVHLGCWSSWGWCPSPLPPFFWSLLLWAAWSWPLVPGQGLCLSHAWLDLRHFMALTLPPTVTAALNEATHMSIFRYKGRQTNRRLDTVTGRS